MRNPAKGIEVRWRAEAPIRITLVGAGGTGARILERLCQMDGCLRALGWAGLILTVCDPDVVSESNLVRGPFYPSDLGINKAVVLAHRAAMVLAKQVRAIKTVFNGTNMGSGDILIDCVDNHVARRQLQKSLASFQLFLHCGNGRDFGQVILGTPREKLKCAYDLHPELLNASEIETPSCSAFESLARQDLYINDLVAGVASNMLWQCIYKKSVQFNVCYINAASGEIRSKLETSKAK